MNNKVDSITNYVKYIFIFAIIGSFLVCLGMSYAYTEDNSQIKVSSTTGKLVYGLSSDDLVNNKLTLEARESKIIKFVITSDNKIDSDFKLYYNILTPNINYVNIGLLDTIGVQEIESYGTKELTIKVSNPNTSKVTVEFSIVGGMPNSEINIPNGFEIG